MSVQSEMMALNSRVTSPLQSSYSATLLDSSDVTFSKPYTDYTNSISPPLISSEELLTPTQSSPVSYPTTNFANNPPVLSSDVKRVQPFTVKKISSSRISNTSITPTQSSPAGIADDSTGAKIITSVDSHSESAFSKLWSSNIIDNAIVMSGLPTDVSGSNSVVNHSDDDEDDSDATPPPLPPSLPPDAFESDSFFDQADIISDDIPPPDLPSIPPPSVPVTTNIVEDEVLDTGIPPLPTSPIPFEPSSNEQPFIESLPIEPPKNFSQTPPEIVNTDVSVSTEFRTAEMVLDKMKQAPDHKTGLQLDVCKRSSPKTVRPISHYNTRDVESLSQTPASTDSSRHSIHLQYDLEPENNKSNVLPMFVSQQLVTQHHDDEPLDSRTQKSSKKSSKLKFPWQKRLTHDRSHSMSEERHKRKSKKSSREGIDIRHSSADIKQDVTDSSVILRNRNVNRLRGTNEPVTSASVGDLRRPITVSIDSFSASHMELNKGGLEPSKPPKDEVDEKTSPNHQQALKVGESTISLPHMTTPELYRRLCEPSNSSLLESVMKDIPLFNANTTAAEETMEQTPVEDQSKGDSTLADQQKELVINPEALLDQKEESFTADMGANQSPVRNSEECLSSNLSDSLHDDVTVDSFGSPPSPVCSIRSDQGWSSSAADTPNFHDRRWRETALGSINTLTSNDSLRDLLRQRVTIGDWNVDHVVHWLESVGLSSVVPVFQQYSIDGTKLKSLSDTKLAEIGIHSAMLREQILQETWELLTANNETLGRRPRKTSSLLKGVSMVQKDTDSQQLSSKMSENMTLLQTSGKQQQGEVLDDHLVAAGRERQEETRELLEGGLAAFMASKNSKDHGGQRRSVKVKSLTAVADPEYWTVDQVCEWLDQIGLGFYTAIFQEHQIDGSALCSLDMQTFDEMGVDSDEDREMILAKVYELFSPENETYNDYDDIEAMLKKYSGEELEKMQAAISALKSPLLADDVEFESSPTPFYFGSANSTNVNDALSRSDPLLVDIQYDDDDSIPGTPDPRHMRQGSIPLSKAYMRRYGQQSYMNPLNQQFPALRRSYGRFSSVEDSPPPPLPIKQLSVVSDDSAVSPTAPFVHSATQASPITTSTPAGTPSNLEAGDEIIAEQQSNMQQQEQPVMVNTEYPTKLAGKLAAKRKAASMPRAAQPAAATEVTADGSSKQTDIKMKGPANHLPHGDKLEGDASGVKVDSEGGQPSKQKKKKKTVAAVGKKVNTTNVKTDVMQSGLVRLYMVDIPHFAHVIYQAYLISLHTTSHELIELVLKRADIMDDPYRYIMYEKCMEENTSDEGVILKREDCPLQLQVEWPNFYGKRFELHCQPSHVVTVRTQIRDFPTTTRPIQITTVTPCSTLISLAIHTFQLPKSYDELRIVAVHTKNKMEKELNDSDIPMKFITAQNAKWIVFSLRETAELEESAAAIVKQQQQQQQSPTMAVNNADIQYEDASKESMSESTSPSQDVVSSRKINELQERCAVLKNEKEQMERHLNDLQRHYNAMAMKSSNETLAILEKENNTLGSELSTLQNKSALDAHTVTQLSETVSRLEKLVKEKDNYIQSMSAINTHLQQGNNKMKEQIKAYKDQQRLDGETLQDLKDTVEKLDGNMDDNEQAVIQLQQENAKLNKLLHEKEEQLKRSHSTSSKDDRTITALKASLSKQEKDTSFLKKEHQRQTLQLKATEEQINSMRKVLKQKDEVITQLSDIELLKSTSPRSSLHSMLIPHGVGSLMSVRAEPQGESLGIKVSSTEGAGCLVMEVADHSPLASTVQQGDRLLEINGEDISNSNIKQVMSLLKNRNKPMQFVLLRLGPYSSRDESDAIDENMLQRLHDLNASLKEQVKKQMSETQYWRNEYEQVRDALSANVSLQQEKDSEIAYCKSTIEGLNEQLTESRQTQEQLKVMLEELHQQSNQHAGEASVDQAIQEHIEQLEMMETNHKKQVQALQKVIKEKDQKIQLFRQHLVISHPLDSSSLQAHVKHADNLKAASQAEVLNALKESESDRARHQAYLDQLLLLVIERCPELLNNMTTSPDNTRNKAEKWC